MASDKQISSRPIEPLKPTSSQPAVIGDAEPMTPRLMARLFMVPALIVCLLLAVAVVVVLFGSTSSDKPASIEELLARLEADTGERTLNYMLMPKAKEAWQAAQELARRFETPEKFLSPPEIESTSKRLADILSKYPPGRNVDEPGPAQQYFVMMALARLGSPTAVAPLAALLKDENWWTRRTALESLAAMRTVPEAKRSLSNIAPLLDDPQAAVRIVACAAVAALAEPGDAAAIGWLKRQLDADAEVQWNAATALARLGSPAGKLVLLNMLNRSYWEKMQLQYMDAGTLVRRQYSEAEVANHLVSAIEAAAFIQDSELSASIAALADDRALAVREAVRRSRPGAAGEPESAAPKRDAFAGKSDGSAMTMRPWMPAEECA